MMSIPEQDPAPDVWPPPIHRETETRQPFAFVSPIEIRRDGDVFDVDCPGLRQTVRLRAYGIAGLAVWITIDSAWSNGTPLSTAYIAVVAVMLAGVVMADIFVLSHRYLFRFDRKDRTLTTEKTTVPYAACTLLAENPRGRFRLGVYGPFRRPERARVIGDFHTMEEAKQACADIELFMSGGEPRLRWMGGADVSD